MRVQMNYLLQAPEERWRTSVKLPASKSISNRALILNALSYSPFEVENLSDCDDTNSMTRVLNSNDRDFDIGAAGTTMRFLTAFLSKVVGEWTLTGSERMKKRPIKVLVEALNSIGANVEYMENEGFPKGLHTRAALVISNYSIVPFCSVSPQRLDLWPICQGLYRKLSIGA